MIHERCQGRNVEVNIWHCNVKQSRHYWKCQGLRKDCEWRAGVMSLLWQSVKKWELEIYVEMNMKRKRKNWEGWFRLEDDGE
jgi:hypothetical protein